MRLVRVLVRAILVIAAIALLAILAGIGRGYYIIGHEIRRPIPELRLSMDPVTIARGRHVAEVRCLGCHSAEHSDSLPLVGGTVEIFENPLHLDRATLPYPNLTPGGPLAGWSDGAIARAIREGLDKNGRPLILMPSGSFRQISDDDLAALVAFLRSQPPLLTRPGTRHADWFTALGLALGMFGTSLQPPVTAPIPAVSPDNTMEFGAYLARSLRCSECHGEGLHGAAGPDLHAYARQYPESLFVRSVQRGRRATDGSKVAPFMPWRAFGLMTPEELGALYRWLRGTR